MLSGVLTGTRTKHLSNSVQIVNATPVNSEGVNTQDCCCLGATPCDNVSVEVAVPVSTMRQATIDSQSASLPQFLAPI
jgi:hypothetical protein